MIATVDQLISFYIAFNPLVFTGSTFSCFGMLDGMLCNDCQRFNLFGSIAIITMTFICVTLFDISALQNATSWMTYVLSLTNVSKTMRR